MDIINKNNEEIAKLKSLKSEIEQLSLNENQETIEFNEAVKAHKKGLINDKEFDEIYQKHINKFDNFITKESQNNHKFRELVLKER